MTDAEAPHFLLALNAVAEIFHRELSDMAQTLYFDALKDLPLEACLQALQAAVQQQTFMPQVAELRVLILGDSAVAIEAAWLEYKRVAFTVGGYRSPTFTDGVLAQTLEAIFGSWEQACWVDLSPELWVAKRREFERVYRVLQSRRITGPVTLRGFCARVNADMGYPDAPVEIGPDTRETQRRLLTGRIERRRIDLEAQEALREVWRTNVQRALEAHHDGPREGATA
jgi:hypothetical protein